MSKTDDMRRLRAERHGRFSASRDPVVAEVEIMETDGPGTLMKVEGVTLKQIVEDFGEGMTPQERLDVERGLAARAMKRRTRERTPLGERVSAYVSVEEAAAMEEAALAAGMTLSSWARRVLLKEVEK